MKKLAIMMMVLAVSSLSMAAVTFDFEGANPKNDWYLQGAPNPTGMSAVIANGPAGNDVLKTFTAAANNPDWFTWTWTTNPAGGLADTVRIKFDSSEQVNIQADWGTGGSRPAYNRGQFRLGLIDTDSTANKKGLQTKIFYDDFLNQADVQPCEVLNDVRGIGVSDMPAAQSWDPSPTGYEYNRSAEVYRMMMTFSHDDTNLTLTGEVWTISDFGGTEVMKVSDIPSVSVPLAAYDLDPTNRGMQLHMTNIFWNNNAGTAGWDWAHQYVDNVQLEVVPEPATLALLGLGSVLLSRKRKS